jgi:hypothetical protein
MDTAPHPWSDGDIPTLAGHADAILIEIDRRHMRRTARRQRLTA